MAHFANMINSFGEAINVKVKAVKPSAKGSEPREYSLSLL